MIVVTGGLGFIGRNLVKELMRRGNNDIMVLDSKAMTLESIYDWFKNHVIEIECIYHLGAITDTTETNNKKFEIFNVNFSIILWTLCYKYNIPLVYASSAATYGDGKYGFDDEINIKKLKPLNLYGLSKQEFDLYILEFIDFHQSSFWVGLKFFNVYGYGESDKGRMASMIYHTYNQIKETGEVKLFKSYNDDYKDGEQLRDFIYVDDIVDVCINMMEKKTESGIYNVGTGKARSFNDLAKAVFNCLGIQEKINYIDIPIDVKNQYQYFTEAKIDKLINSDCGVEFHGLEEGISKYIKKLENENCKYRL